MREEQIFEALRAVIDPEIGVNIVELGLVYDIDVEADTVDVEMTMTTPTCPLHAVIARDVENVIKDNFEQVRHVNVNLVWKPSWSPEMMSKRAKHTLGWV